MLVLKAAIMGPEVDSRVLRAGVAAFASRDDVETLEPLDRAAELTCWLEAGEQGAALVFPHPEPAHAIARVKELARTIATSTQTTVRACFSGVVEHPGRIVPDYATFEITGSGLTRNIEVEEADRFLREHPTVPGDPKEEMWELLFAQQGEAPAQVLTEGLGFAFRMRPLVEDPRLAELLAAARGASSVELTEQADGRTLLRMTLADGSRRLAFLDATEHETFTRLHRASG